MVQMNCAPVSILLSWWEPETTALPVDLYSVEHWNEGEKGGTMGKTCVSIGS